MLAKVLFWVCAGLAAALWISVVYARKQKKDAAKYKNMYEDSDKMIAGLTRTIGQLRGEAVIKSENRKEADEKIEELHDGDALGNALNRLRKHENN